MNALYRGPELPGPCSCDSTPGPNAWSNFKTEPPAPWTSNAYTPAYYRTTFAATLPMLLQLPYASILSCSLDWMHCKYLGVDQYFLGSVLMFMVGYLMTGETGRSIEICTLGTTTSAVALPPSGNKHGTCITSGCDYILVPCVIRITPSCNGSIHTIIRGIST